MAKRKAHKQTTKVDFMKPINITVFGTEDDPCFGKHWSPKAPECNRCGDSELCSVIVSQNMNVKRQKLEAKGNFMDVEESKTINMEDVEKAIIRHIKTHGDISLIECYKLIRQQFDKKKLLESHRIKSIAKKIIQGSLDLKTYKKQNKRFIKVL